LQMRAKRSLCQKLSTEAHVAGSTSTSGSTAGRTAGAPSPTQGATTGEGEPRDGQVSGRGSQCGYWYIHGQLLSCYGAFRYRCYSFFHFQVICRAASYSSFMSEVSYGSCLTWGPDTHMLYMLQS